MCKKKCKCLKYKFSKGTYPKKYCGRPIYARVYLDLSQEGGFPLSDTPSRSTMYLIQSNL